MGNKTQSILDAKKQISSQIGEIKKTSSFYESEPWGFNSSEWFINCVIEIKTPLTAIEVLQKLLEIESCLGRVRNPNEKGYSSRIIDLDMLFFNDEIICNPNLEIPHPRLHLRKFTMMPLVEIYPNFVHPQINKTLRKISEDCVDVSEVNIL